jgi:hypothetical protein
MMTWTLVLVMSAYMGYSSAATIPGYASESTCTQAGKAWMDARQATNARFVCVPGPR